MKKLAFIISLFILIAVIVRGINQTYAQSVNEVWFENGHRLSGEFLSFYSSVPNPEQLYGNPITDAYKDSTTEIIVQYFEKTRFELHSEEPPGLRVKLSPLGSYLYQKNEGTVLPVQENSTACRGFPNVEHKVCYAFREFYEENGGIRQFGAPLANQELYGDLIVQYFENARFEWHQELPEGNKVVLSDLGRQYFLLRGEDRSRLLSNRNAQNAQSITHIEASAFVEHSVMPNVGQQTIYFVVQDQRQLPVPNAQILFDVKFPDGKTNHFGIPDRTNAEGILKYSFPYSSSITGPVYIHGIVFYKQLNNETQTSFRIWY